jgi:phasin family protein
MKAAGDAAEFGRGNVEALTKATQAYVAGVQDLGRQTFALMQGLTDHAIEGAKALAAVKSIQEAAQIQANYTRAAIEKSVNESAKLGENALKLAEQSFAPLTARVTLAVEKFGRAPSLAA